MQDAITQPPTNETPGAAVRPPKAFHHNSWVVADQERTRAFYEDLLGIPLVAFWIERAKAEGEQFVFGHAFYGMQDGTRLSFFNFEMPAHQARFKSPATEVFNHIAMEIDDETLAKYQQILTGAGVHHWVLDHGYCRSLYVIDPDGLRLEFAVNHPQHDEINAEQLQTAHASLTDWMEGRHASNNRWAPASGER